MDCGLGLYGSIWLEREHAAVTANAEEKSRGSSLAIGRLLLAADTPFFDGDD